jgi:PEP-CTERM/exosortase A-associated glycosyltransferase
MHILHVLDHSVPLQSGYSFRTVDILKHQRMRGWSTAHITSTKHYQADCEIECIDGYTFYRTLPTGSLLEQLPIAHHVSVIRSLERRLETVCHIEQPDIIHAHSPALNGVAAIRVGRRLRIPVVYEMRASWEDAAVDHAVTTEGSLRYRASRALETWVLRRASQVVTISQGLYHEILARVTSASRVTIVPNAVDLSSFTDTRDRDQRLAHELGLGDAVVLGFAGSFYRYEGLDVLLRALPEICSQVAGVRALFVGGGAQREPLKALALELGLEKTVVFTGRVPHDEVASYYSLMDILVYPRRPNRLTELVTPLKPLEAMAQRKLVVASDVGGHRELIKDKITGLLFAAGDHSNLARLVVGLLQDPKLQQNIIAHARRFVEDERTWSSVVESYEQVYAAALAQAA